MGAKKARNMKPIASIRKSLLGGFGAAIAGSITRRGGHWAAAFHRYRDLIYQFHRPRRRVAPEAGCACHRLPSETNRLETW